MNTTSTQPVRRITRSAQGTTAPAPAAAPVDHRCHCGSLLARLVPYGVELKCRRCKRTVVVALERG